MTEPELLKTLERLESEELLDATTPELPLPDGGEDYLSILQDLRDALGEPDELREEPETSFADPQNILELDHAHNEAAQAAEFENELDLLPETAGFDFSGEETESAFSEFELKLPDEIFPPQETPETIETPRFEQLSRDSEPLVETASLDDVAEPENPPLFFQAAAETVQPEPEITETEDSVSLEDFLSMQQFSAALQISEPEAAADSFDFQEEESLLDFETPQFFNEFAFEENSIAEPDSNFDSPAEFTEKRGENGFDFVTNAEETEFPEIIHDEETNEFSIEEFATPEIPSSETIADFETKNLAPEIEDFSDFLPDATKDFLNDLDVEPELPQFEPAKSATETALPEFSLANEVEETEDSRSPFVVFKLDAKHFAFPAAAVAEISHEPQFTSLPFVPRWFSGVTNLRGDVVAVLDLRGLWEMPAALPDARRKMLVVRSEKENLTVGLLVDSVSEIRYLGESEIDFAPKFFDQPFAFCVNGSSRQNESILPILDVERFLASPELRQV